MSSLVCFVNDRWRLHSFQIKNNKIRIVTEFDKEYAETIISFEINNKFFDKKDVAESLLKPFGIETPQGKQINSFYYIRDALNKINLISQA